jgi:hypothetical protein
VAGGSFDIPRVLTVYEDKVVRGMGVAVAYLTGRVQRDISISNRDRKTPSLPGEPPRKVTGRLFKSIAWNVRVEGMKVIGRVGSNEVYARYLERGTMRADGSPGTAPRPFLRPALLRETGMMTKMIQNRAR